MSKLPAATDTTLEELVQAMARRGPATRRQESGWGRHRGMSRSSIIRQGRRPGSCKHTRQPRLNA